jgi:hypothetical protein
MGKWEKLMNNQDRFEKKKLIELLNKCWMTHDGMWFYHCLSEYGIDAANKLNKAAIRSLAPIEVHRMKKHLGIKKERLETFEDFKSFFTSTYELFIPEFMNATMSFPRENVLHWEFEPGKCFAYQGINALGAIREYECGVIYRIACWVENLGVRFHIEPEIVRCRMIECGTCHGDIILDLS